MGKESEKDTGISSDAPISPLKYFTFEGEGGALEPSKDEGYSDWSVAWADLMMTMFIMFAMMFIYMKSERNITEAFQPGDGSGAPQEELSHKFSSGKSNLFPENRHLSSSDYPLKSTLSPEGSVSRVGRSSEPSKAGLSPEEILKLAENAVNEADLENVQVLLQDDDTVKISLRGPLLFDLGSADLRPQTQSFLDKVATVLSRLENEIHVVGHTDTFPIYTPMFPTNWELSAARAAAVARHLIRVADLDPGRFTIMGHSMYKPALPNTSLENKQLNRRVEIIITKKIYTPNLLMEDHGSG